MSRCKTGILPEWPVQFIAFTTGYLTMPATLQTIILLSLSNVFMTFAWYAHLKEMGNKPWIIAALVSWGIALFEYLLQVPANRIGFTVMSLAQLKIVQEVITLAVFVPVIPAGLLDQLLIAPETAEPTAVAPAACC